MTDYRNRITGLEYVASKDLTPHPGNWREHGKAQTEALRGILSEVGIAGALLAYRSERNGGKLTVIDGHLRKDAAPQSWPVLVLDVDDAEADYILATHDPLAAMATADAAALDALLSSVNSGEAAVQAMLAELAKGAGLYEAQDGEGDIVTQARTTLAERFLIPPFSVLDARQGYWQTRKRAWIALGIQSELGRGITEDSQNYRSDYGVYDPNMGQRANATPGGSQRPAASLGSDGHTVRGDGRGRKIKGRSAAAIGGAPLPLDRKANGKGLARTFGQDLMRGEHTVGENRLTWVAGTRPRDSLDDTSRKNLAAGMKKQGFPHGPTVTQNPDGTLHYRGASRDEWLQESDGNQSSGTSIFDPVLCEIAYTWFTAQGATVLDPFSGGSVRGIVAAYLGRKYTGVDLRGEQIAANEQQAATIIPDNLPRWITGNSLTDIPGDPVDFIFSCPPYYDLEIYSEIPGDLSNHADYAAFLADYRSIVAQAVARLHDNRFACFVVGDIRDKKGNYRNFVSDTIAAFRDAGMELYNEAILVTAVGSLSIRVGKQFSSGRKLGKTHQNVLVFVKGDGRKATQWCGSVEVGTLDSPDNIGAAGNA